MPTTPDALPGSRITEQPSHRHTDLRPDRHSHPQPALPQVSLREWYPPSHAESGCCGHSPSSLTRFPQDHPAFRLSHLRTAGAMPSCLPSGSPPWFLSYLPVRRVILCQTLPRGTRISKMQSATWRFLLEVGSLTKPHCFQNKVRVP